MSDGIEMLVVDGFLPTQTMIPSPTRVDHRGRVRIVVPVNDDRQFGPGSYTRDVNRVPRRYRDREGWTAHHESVTAVVFAEATVADCVPISQCNEFDHHVCRNGRDLMEHWPLTGRYPDDTETVWPLYGDICGFDEGAWAVMLSDITRLDEPVENPVPGEVWECDTLLRVKVLSCDNGMYLTIPEGAEVGDVMPSWATREQLCRRVRSTVAAGDQWQTASGRTVNVVRTSVDDNGDHRAVTRDAAHPDAPATDYLASELVRKISGPAAPPSAPVDRIVWNRRPDQDGGDIDELVIHDVTVHIEQMSDNAWWIGLRRGDHEWTGNFHVDDSGRLRFSEQDNDGIVWAHDTSHSSEADHA